MQALGSRICIIGPSNSGKSTLVDGLGNKLGLKIVHLDLLAREPHANWKRRPATDFQTDHDSQIQEERWGHGRQLRRDNAAKTGPRDIRHLARCCKE